ncbi:Uma2 family endonuclease [Capnocytophaga sp. ARDL2]|uniref:Uma2 family endonuclease n=1 Tax=Capnocytophaga sp. ARDL2 TaxID=3238809 RepID=UPI0035568C13
MFAFQEKEKNNKDILTVVQPDLCVICDESKLDDKGCLGAPDLIIEILSPGNSKKEMKKRFSEFEKNANKRIS